MPSINAYTLINMSIKKQSALDFLQGSLGKDYILSRSKYGINSQVYFARRSQNENYVLKLYKEPAHNNSRDRYNSEKQFLLFCQEAGIKNVPRLVHCDDNNGWIIMTMQQGNHPVEFKTREVENLCEFVLKINMYKYTRRGLALPLASEACQEYRLYANYIKQKLKNLKILYNNQGINPDEDQFLTSCLAPELEIELLKSNKRFSQKHWNMPTICSTISPSDVGIHNMLSTETDVNFLDFEYSGWDDCSKLYGDIMLNPMHIISAKEAKISKKFLRNKTICKDNSWIDRYHDIRKLIIINWCLILMKINLINHQKNHKFMLANDYFKKASMIY